ncbi:hypothetical protein KKI23_00790 [Patescibacteria group bacterium]|nr:hypothetical protein [Patescibacteria group bacterium]
MPLKRYLIGISLSTLLCWLAWVTVLYYINPESSGFIGLFCFYISLLIALVGTFALLGFFFRVWFSREEIVYKHVGISLRQSLLFSILIVGSLLLLGVELLTWWNGLLFIMGLAVFELFFLTRQSSPHHRL